MAVIKKKNCCSLIQLDNISTNISTKISDYDSEYMSNKDNECIEV